MRSEVTLLCFSFLLTATFLDGVFVCTDPRAVQPLGVYEGPPEGTRHPALHGEGWFQHPAGRHPIDSHQKHTIPLIQRSGT